MYVRLYYIIIIIIYIRIYRNVYRKIIFIKILFGCLSRRHPVPVLWTDTTLRATPLSHRTKRHYRDRLILSSSRPSLRKRKEGSLLSIDERSKILHQYPALTEAARCAAFRLT